jgi:dTDP-4-amino-4,6-dideoxygalactose transaminase
MSADEPKREGSRRSVAVAKPSFDEDEERRIVEVLRSGWVSQGPRVQEFEQAFADKTQARQAVATSSGTTALFLALKSLDVGPGDEVLVPSLSFIASANVIVHCGATPVFVDVDPSTYNLDPKQVEIGVSEQTKAVMVVHQLGLPADLHALDAVARHHQLHVVEDAACAVGSRYAGQPIGSSDNLTCFSFHPRKVLVTGEGGMITTADPALAARLRRLRHQGMSVSDLERHQADRVIIEEYPEVGYNFRLSDLQAAIGLAQLGKLDELLRRRREVAASYDSALKEVDLLDIPFTPDYAEPNYQSYILRVRGLERSGQSLILNEMKRRGVALRRGLMACHREIPYHDVRRVGTLPHTERAADETLVLPMHAELSAEEQGYVIGQLLEVLDGIGILKGADRRRS